MNLKIDYKIVAIISVLFSLSGCMTLGTLEIEVIKPAKITLPSEIKSLLVINNSLLFHDDSFTNDNQKGLFKLDTTTTQFIARQLNSILNESPRFDTSILIQDIYFRSEANLLKPIDWGAVKKLSALTNTDAIVSLEAFGIVDTTIRTSQYDGYAYTTYKSLMLIASSLWRIYLVDEEKVLEKRIQRDTVVFYEFESKKDYFSALAEPKVLDYLAKQISNTISIKVADRMAPYWQPIQRDFFIYENSEMKKAARYAYTDNWRAAASIWKLFTDNKNKRLAAAACYNMALVCEVEGKLDIAEHWLEESLEKYNSNIAHEYMNQIKARIKESVELDKQFGIE